MVSVNPDVLVEIQIIFVQTVFLEPDMLITCLVNDKVYNDLHAQRMGVRHQASKSSSVPKSEVIFQ